MACVVLVGTPAGAQKVGVGHLYRPPCAKPAPGEIRIGFAVGSQPDGQALPVGGQPDEQALCATRASAGCVRSYR